MQTFMVTQSRILNKLSQLRQINLGLDKAGLQFRFVSQFYLRKIKTFFREGFL